MASNRPGGLGGLDLYASQRPSTTDPWGQPQNLGPTINSAANDHCPFVTPDGHELIYATDRPGVLGVGDFLVSSRRNKYDDLAWEAPVNPGPPLNTMFDEFGPTAFENEGTDELTFYFTSNRPGGLGGYDIYSSLIPANGIFGPPALVPELSSSAEDQFPTVSRRDGLELFLSSNRTGTLGSFDLWVARRSRTSDPWLTPENLGPTVNSANNDQRPAISWFANRLIFSSSREGNQNVYEATRDIPVVTAITFDAANVRNGGSFTATISGSNLTDKTYFDVRFRPPGGTTDDTVLNWQQGMSVRHTLANGTETGSWMITGIRAHQDVNDRTGPFVAVSAALNNVAF